MLTSTRLTQWQVNIVFCYAFNIKASTRIFLFFFHFSGTFRWDDTKDKLLLREVRLVEPYLERVGSKESGTKWSEIASALNTHSSFKDSSRDQRSVRDRFTKMLSDFKAKMRKEEGSSGTNPPDLTEKEQILEEIKEIIESNQSNNQTKPSSTNQKNERAKALSIRDKAMNTWSKTNSQGSSHVEDESDSDELSTTSVHDVEPKRKKRKRRGGASEALDYLSKKYSGEYELRKEELEVRKGQFEVEQKRVEMEKQRQDQMQDFLMQQQRQMAAQQQQQQQQIQQQMAFQTQIIALLAKMPK